MVDKIWLVEYAYEGADYREDWSVDWDQGFFLSEEAAQSRVTALENVGDKYVRYVSEQANKHKQAMESYEKRVRQWDILQAAGEPMESARPAEPVYRVQDFTDWLKRYRPGYRVECLERGDK